MPSKVAQASVSLFHQQREAMARCIRAMLTEEGLDTAEVLEWIEQEAVEYVDDLAHSFRSAKHVQEEAPHLLEAWLAAAGRKTEAWRKRTDYADAVKHLREASLAIAADCKKLAPPAKTLRGGPVAGRPRPKALAKARARDEQSRREAARAAVALSLEWAPQAGLARGLKRDDPLLDLVREVHEARVAEFEPKGVWAAMRNWKSWGEYQTKFHERDEEAAKVILLSAYLSRCIS